MSYGADFANADPANAPLDAPILLGADPILWAALLLLLLAALLLGWFMGARSRGREGDATASIWKAIDKAAKEAMKADDNALRGRAQTLLETIERRLGKTLSLAGGKDGLTGCVAALRGAVAGRRPQLAHDKDDHGHRHDRHGHGDRKADGDHGDAEHKDAAGSSATASGANITINVSQPAPRPEKPGHGHDHGHDRHRPPRDMTAREQTDALRLAVAAFNEHWRHEGARLGELRGALTELSGSNGRGGPNLSHG